MNEINFLIIHGDAKFLRLIENYLVEFGFERSTRRFDRDFFRNAIIVVNLNKENYGNNFTLHQNKFWYMNEEVDIRLYTLNNKILEVYQKEKHIDKKTFLKFLKHMNCKKIIETL